MRRQRRAAATAGDVVAGQLFRRVMLGNWGTVRLTKDRARGLFERARGRALARDPIEPAWALGPVLIALTIGWVLMVWPWLAGRVTIPWDAKAHFQPQIQFMAQSLARGEWPWWTPNVFAGHPQIADPQSLLFSPPFVLLALFNANPSLWAVDVTVLAMQLAGAAALVAWFRDQNWHWAGGLLAGLVFAFGASMAWRLQHTGQVLSLCYWPMAMLAIDRMLRWRSYRWAIASGLMAAVIVLGRDQVALLVMYLLAAYALWTLVSQRRESGPRAIAGVSGPLLLAAVVAVAVVAIPLTLTAMFAAGSNRPSIDFEGAGRGSMHPALFLTFIIPQVFGAAFRMEDYWGPPSFAWNDTGLFIAQNMGQVYLGAIPLLLILLAAFQRKLFDRQIIFFTVAFALVCLYALGWYTPAFRVFYEVLPGVKFYRRPADATFLIGALSAVLAGHALHRLFERPWRRTDEHAIALTIGTVALAFITALVLSVWLDRVGTLSYPLTIAFGCFAAGTIALVVAKPRIALEPWPMALLIAGATALDLGYNNGPSTSSGLPPATYEAMQPNTRNATIQALKSRLAEAHAADPSGTRRDRIELLGLGFHWPNLSLTHNFENTLGYNPLRLDLYSKATGAEDHVGLPSQRKFSKLLPSYRSRLVDMLGLRYIAAGEPFDRFDKGVKAGDFQLLAKTDDAWIYENPRAMARVLFVPRAIGANFEQILQTGNWPAGFDPATTVLLADPPPAPAALTGAAAAANPAGAAAGTTVRVAYYRNTEIGVDVEGASAGWLVLNDPWQPWWTVDVDGIEQPLLRANVLFRAVGVPAGRHVVRFRFRPLVGAWRQLRNR